MKFRGSPAMKSIDEARQMINTLIRTESGVSKHRLGIRLRKSDELVGTLLLQFPAEQPEQCEIGFSFGKEHWGRGYAQETLALIEERLLWAGITTVVAWCRSGNLTSIHLFRKAGYQEVEQVTHSESLLFSKQLESVR